MRFAYKLLLLNVLAACGAPGSDSVFTKGNPKAASGTAATAAAAPSPSPRPPRIEAKLYAGYFRRYQNQSQFQPCGTSKPLPLFSTPPGHAALRDRIRFNGVWEGSKWYAVFAGAIVTDTVVASGDQSDTTTPRPRTRFLLVSVDSFRNWQSGDCGGMRIP